MKGVMIQGTASHVGKSILTTSICRMLANRGYRIAPFKAQNMSSHTVKLDKTKEIGVSQFEQAEASKLTPETWMNPVLLKPLKSMRTEVFLLGESQGSISGVRFKDLYYEKAMKLIKEALVKAESRSDYTIIEGAGSPVEMNLRERDLSNMAIAELADIPVLLVADIERGGIFASIVGTLTLLTESERKRVKGIIINKFIGNTSLFADGITWLEENTGIPVLGVIPYIEHKLDEEDTPRGIEPSEKLHIHNKEADYELLAAHIETHMDVEKLLQIMDGTCDGE